MKWKGLTLGFALLIAGLTVLSQAQPSLHFPPGVFQNRAAIDGGAAAGYQGPGDIVGYTAWGGLQAYSAATRGMPAIRACDTATGLVCADFSTDATTGKLVVGTISGLTCISGINCSIITVYDILGNGCTGATTCSWVSQGAVSTWPTLVAGPSGNPVANCASTSSQTLGSSNNFTSSSQPYSMSAVAKSVNTGAQQSLLYIATSVSQMGFRNSANNQIYIFAGSVLPVTATDGSFYSLQGVFNGTTISDINVDGTATTGNASTVGANGKSYLCSVSNSSQFMNGQIGEFGFAMGTAFSGATSLALSVLAHSRWGF